MTSVFSQGLARLAGRLRSDEGGFTIIEVLVSALLLAIVSVGLLMAFDSATKASGTNKARTIAAQLAQADQERLRSMTGSQLVALGTNTPPQTKQVDGRTFTITSTAIWTNDPTGTGSCGGLGKEPGYQRITSSVSWPDRGTLAPVQSDSLKAVPNGGYSTTRGSLAVKLTDRNGAAVNGIPVSISGPTSASATTSGGCALFGFVPIGTYTVTIGSGTTYVRDVLPNDFVVTKSTAVQGEQTSTISINYDKAASLGVAFYTGSTSSTRTNGDGFSVGAAGLGSPYFRSFALPDASPSQWAFTGTGTAAVSSTSDASPAGAQKVLYPFTGYRVWAGRCQVNDPTQSPTNIAEPNGTISMTQGGAMTAAKVIEPTLTSTLASGSGYFKVSPTTPGCTAVASSTASTAAGSFATSLPYGSYSVCVQDKPIGQTPTQRSLLTGVLNNTTAGKTQSVPAMTAGTTPC